MSFVNLTRYLQISIVILFLKNNGVEVVPMVGWGQGVFFIERRDELGDYIVKDMDGRKLIDVKGEKIVKEQKITSRQRITSDSEIEQASWERSENKSEVEQDFTSGGGVFDDGSKAKRISEGMVYGDIFVETVSNQAAMPLGKFVSEIKSRAIKLGKKSGKLEQLNKDYLGFSTKVVTSNDQGSPIFPESTNIEYKP